MPNLVGELHMYGNVWYDPKWITNILSLKNIKRKDHVVYDSNGEGDVAVTKPDGTVF